MREYRRIGETPGDSYARGLMQGDQLRWGNVYKEYYQRLRRFFAASLANPEDVDDLVQAVFSNLIKRRVIPDDPRTYIFTVARNQLNSYWREKKRRNRQVLSLVPEYESTSEEASLEADPLELLCNDEERHEIERAMRNMPAILACALRLRIVLGIPLRDAAQQAGCSCAVMKKRLQRAKRFLLELYEE